MVENTPISHLVRFWLSIPCDIICIWIHRGSCSRLRHRYRDFTSNILSMFLVNHWVFRQNSHRPQRCSVERLGDCTNLPWFQVYWKLSLTNFGFRLIMKRAQTIWKLYWKLTLTFSIDTVVISILTGVNIDGRTNIAVEGYRFGVSRVHYRRI